MTAEAIVSRLDGVRETGAGRWVAKCPAHDDRGPSLSVRETDDGRTLLNCFAGCATADVLSAIGATWGDLYPPRKLNDPPQRRRRAPLTTASDALKCIAHEALIVAIAASDLARDETLSEDDRQRLLEAAGRISRAVDACHA